MKNNIVAFNYEEQQVRTIEKNSEPWFVGKDVADILGYTDTAQAVRKHIDDEDKGVVEMTTPGGKQNMVIINESGLYSLILSSKLPTARAFKRWVTSEVLPAIRKNGGYIAGQETLSPEELMAKALLVAQKTIEEKDKQLTHAAEQAKLDAPLVHFAKGVTVSKTSILIFDFAKILRQNGADMGGKRFFAWLRENGYLVKRNGSDYNMPTQRSMELGLFEIKETVITHSDGHTTISRTPKITGKGQVYFFNKILGTDMPEDMQG
jgi:anti-repressor protein